MNRRKFVAGALAALAGVVMAKKARNDTLPTTHELVSEVRVQYTTADDEPLPTGQQNQVAAAAEQAASAKVSELGGEVLSSSGVIHDPQ